MAGGKGDRLDWGGRPRSSGNIGQRLAHVPNSVKTQAEGLGTWGAGWGPGPCGHRRGALLPQAPPLRGPLATGCFSPTPALSAQAPFHQCLRPGAEHAADSRALRAAVPAPASGGRAPALGAPAASRPLSEPLSAPGFPPTLAPRSARSLALRPSPRTVPDLPRHHPHSTLRKRPLSLPTLSF